MSLPQSKHQFHSKSIGTKIIRKYILKTGCLRVYPVHILRPDLSSPQYSGIVDRGIIEHNPKQIDEVIEGEDLWTLDYNTYTVV